jgi:hypothetical protein
MEVGMLSLRAEKGCLVGTHSDGSAFDGHLSEADKAELRSYWKRKGERIVMDHAAPTDAKVKSWLAQGIAKGNLRDQIFGTRDTNPIGGHEPGPHSVTPQADAPAPTAAASQPRQGASAARTASPACERWCKKMADLLMEVRLDPELAAEIEAFNLAQGLVAQGFGGPDETAAPPVVPSKNNPSGASPAASALPKTQDSLEGLLPTRRQQVVVDLDSFTPSKGKAAERVTLESLLSSVTRR